MTMIRDWVLASLVATSPAMLACDGKGDPAPPAPPAAAEEEPPSQEAPAAEAADALPDRDPALAHKLIEEGGLLLDVRTPEEYAEGHIEGAVNIPHDQIADQLDQLVELTGGDKGKAIVVYCRSGGRAGKAKQTLSEHGYERVTNVGGMSDW